MVDAGLPSWKQRKDARQSPKGGSGIISAILAGRGIAGKEAVQSFLNPCLSHLHDPRMLPNIEPATERLLQAVEQSEKVLVFGDYDADGVISLCLMYNFLRDLGLGVQTHIPSRFDEGYDINLDFVKKSQSYGLILCVDCGTNSSQVREFLDSNPHYPDMVVCDHHEPADKEDLGRSPKYTIINPKLGCSRYPFQELSGAGVTFKFIIHALRALDQKKKKKFSRHYLTGLLDMVAVSTVADVMPLIGENRVMVKKGLEVLQKTSNKGLGALIAANLGIQKEINTYDIGFVIAPRLNASGRLKTAKESSDILKSDAVNIDQKVKTLNVFNLKRKKIQETIRKEILNIKDLEHTIKNQKIFIAKSDTWNEGVLGIVASDLVKRFHVPVILFKNKEGLLKGSGRSIESFNLYQSLLSLERFFVKFGGHEMACGITMEADRYQDFEKELLKIAARQSKDALKKSFIYDLAIDFTSINQKLFKDLEALAPFGTANPRPVFRTDCCRIEKIKRLKQDRHLKLTLEKDGVYQQALFFNAPQRVKQAIKKEKVNILYTISQNTWNGKSSIQLFLVDLF